MTRLDQRDHTTRTTVEKIEKFEKKETEEEKPRDEISFRIIFSNFSLIAQSASALYLVLID
jgi:hypothetical protein